MSNKIRYVNIAAILLLISTLSINADNQSGAKIIIIIQNPIVSCHNCQLLLDDFINNIKYNRLEKLLMGVYIPMEGRDISIQEKQIKRHLKACGYEFPLIIDYLNIMSMTRLDKYDLLIINGDKISKYKFPLSNIDWNVIRSIG